MCPHHLAQLGQQSPLPIGRVAPVDRKSIDHADDPREVDGAAWRLKLGG
jgi:hypothetical protein